MSKSGFSGGCACGRVKFQTPENPRSVTFCYCVECAKVSGCGYLPFGHVSPESVQWSQMPDIWRSSPVAQRGHCIVCGSTLTMQYDKDPEEIGIVLSAIDSATLSLPATEKHIFLKEKAAWVHIPEDGAARYDQHKPSFQEKFNQWKDEVKG